jgi:hypothetical protein
MNIYDDRREMRFDWARAFVNSDGTALLCRVDGGDGTIPLPNYGIEVSDFETTAAWLVYDLEGQRDPAPAHYLDSIKAKRVPDQGQARRRHSRHMTVRRHARIY